MYNPYQRKLIRDMIMNVVLSLFLIVNLLPVNIGARIVAEEIPSEPNSADVLDSEKQNDNENKEENPSDEGDLSGGNDQENNPTGQENNNEENPADGTKTDEGVPAEGSGTKDETPNEGGSNDDTPVVENDKIIDEEDKKDDKINEEETPKEEEKKEGETLLGAKAGGMTLLAASNEGGEPLRAASGLVGRTLLVGTSAEYQIDMTNGGTYFLSDTQNGTTGKQILNRHNNNYNQIYEVAYDAHDGGSGGQGGVAKYEFSFYSNTSSSNATHIKVKSSEYKEKPIGITITGGNGTQSNPYTWAMVFNEYKITYDLHGGTVSTANPVSYNVAANAFTLNNPTKKGYEFAGWIGTELTQATKAVTIPANSTGDRSYEATWKAINYGITYNLDGGSLPSETTNPITYSIESNITLNNPTKEGKVFLGWTGTGLEAPTKEVTISTGSTGNREYTANWGELYPLTLNPNEGTLPETYPKTYNADLEDFVFEVTPTRNGYSFDGWIIEEGDEPQKKVTIPVHTQGRMEYKAKWSVVNYTITYYGDDRATYPEGHENPTRYNIESDRIELINPTMLGWVFTGWSGTGITGTADTVTIEQGSTGNREYTANWKANTYTIAYNANGGTGKIEPQTKTYGTALKLTEETPSFAGYNFLGWAETETEADKGEFDYEKGATLSKDLATEQGDEYTLFAAWIANTYSIAYNANGGANAPADQTKTYGTDLTLTSDIPTYNGFTFKGWATTKDKADAGTVDYAKGATMSTDLATEQGATVTLYAVWTKDIYTIGYDLAGGTVETANPTSYSVDSAAITLNNPTKTGYTFDGWTGTGLDKATTTVTIPTGSTGNRSYTATWTKDIYTIGYDLAGGTVETANPTSYSVDSAAITLNNPTKEHYNFLGWTGTDLDGLTENVTISKGSTGNREYTANWEATSYSITYDLDGGALPEGQQNYKNYTIKTETFTLINPTKANYNFIGWSGTGITGTSETVIIEKGSYGDRTYTANWIGKEIKVSFDINYEGGTNPEQITVNYDSAYGDLPEVTREGYGFGGWWYESDITEYQVSPNTKVSDLNDHTLKARWTANTYTVKFESNGGSTPSPASKEVTYGKAYGDFTVVNKEGYSFDGWFTAAEGGTRIGEADPVHITTDQTLYAHWTAKTYSLRFRSNGGGNPSVRYKTVTYDSEYGELASIEREGYTFAGWYTRRSGGTQILPEDTVKITADQTLYAHWTANTYTVSFDKNGSLDPDPAPIEVTYGQRYGTLPSVTRVGYEFDGWYTARTGGTQVNWRTTVQTASDHTLYAHWTANTYTVRFNSNGGGNPSVRYKRVTYDSEYGELATIEREGYTFAGWFTAAEGGTRVSPEDKVKITANQTLYAHWTANTYTVTFDSNGGRRPSPRRITVTYDSQYGELATTRRTGYTFDGWFTAAEGGTQVSPEDKVKITANQTLYAHWTANTYTVSFDKNGSVDPDPASKVVTYGQRYGSLPSVTRVGYEFDGWYTARIGGTQVNWRTTVQTASDHTLYAHWTAEKYTVTFDSNGGSRPRPRTKTVTYDSAYGTLPTVTRDGYTFAGWYYESGAMKFEVKPTDIVSVPEDHTLKAYWTANTYTITFNSNGGSDPDPTSKEVTYDQLYGDLPIVTREGYTSEGWYTRQNDGRKITASDTVKITRDRTFYTHWTVIEYPITYNNVSEAVVTNPDKYTVEDSFTLNNPVRQGFDFLGWTGSNGENPQLEVTVSKGTTGELIFNANWQEIEYDDVTGSTVEHVRGVDGDEKFTFKRNIRDEKTYANFVAADRVVKVDGNKLNEKQFEAHSGSLIIVLKKDYLDSLSIGEHLLSVDFLDGGRLFTVTTKFYIRMKPADTDSHVIPTTGIQSESEGGNFYRTISMFAILALGATIKLRNKVGKDYWDEFK